jgi:acyl-homoserine-lactone acylase
MKKILALLAFSFSLQTFAQNIKKENITIARDSFGVPHVFAKTDAEAAYGLAYAHAEDDFKHIQHNLLAARGHLGEVIGKEGVLFDYGLKFMGIDTLVDKLYEKNLSPEFRKVVSGYTQGLNDYAASHPNEVLLKKMLPFKEQDIIKGYTLSLSLMSGVGVALKTIKANKIEEFNNANDDDKGSNAIAIAPSRTEDGKTWLAVNSHQPLEGRFGWYEAHVCSEEGWNMLGGLFPGGMSIFVGSSPNLGWAHTTNYNTWGDIHQLIINPKNKKQYQYDGQWKDFKRDKIKLKVKIAGIKLGVKKKALYTEFGPVFETKHGKYAIRFPAYSEMRAGEQWWRMNKAQNWKEFEKAIKMQAIPSYNIIYADKDGNILYQSGGQYPDRDPKLNWSQPIKAASSQYKWSKLIPYEAIPSNFNPECGFVYNANNTPLHCTSEECNLEMAFPGLQMFETNRGQRLAELMNDHTGPFTWKQFLSIKYDLYYSQKGLYRERFGSFYNLDTKKYPDIADYANRLKKWDFKTDTTSNGAALALMMHKKLTDKHETPFGFFLIKKDNVSESDAVESIRNAQKSLLKTHGSLDVKLGDIQRLIRGNVSKACNGMSDILRAADIKLYDKKKGIYRINQGDGYIQLVKFGKDGAEVRSINCYGASAHPDSKHYTDQMEMAVKEQTKPMTFDKETILKQAEKVYHPY